MSFLARLAFASLILIPAAVLAAQSEKGNLEGKVVVTAQARASAPITPVYGYEAQKGSQRYELPEEIVVYLVKVKGTWPPPKAHAKLDQKYTQFSRRVVPVLVGTTVDFKNNDPVYHNVFSNSDLNEFDLGRRKRGETVSKKMTKVEVPVPVYCEIHRKMKSNLLVLQNPFFTVVKPGGTFKLTGVPPGTYTLATWHDHWEPIQTKVTVTPGKTTKVDLTMDKVSK
jgi:plastocyanin